MEEFTLKILHTSDIHGKIYPFSYEGENTGTMCNAATLINNLRTENTILIDTGDIIQGSAINYYHATYLPKTINPMSKAFNYLNYDCIVLGNHEFNYGQKYLQNFISNVDADIITNNVYKDDKVYAKPYKIVKLNNGFKIAIIGAVIDKVPSWEKDYNIVNLKFKDVLEELKKNLKYIKNNENPDCIIFAYHGGFEISPITNTRSELVRENVGYEILKENRDINILLTGHQHKKHVGIENGIIYTQPGSNGAYVAEINIKYKYNDGRWVQVKSEARLLESKKYDVDKKFLKLNENISKKVEKWLNYKLGFLVNGDINPTNPFNDRFNVNSLFTFINKVQIYASGVDISCCSLQNKFVGLSGTITPKEILNLYKYSNYLVVIEMEGRYLLEALLLNSQFFSLKNGEVKINEMYEKPKCEYYNYDVYYGIDYTINLSKKTEDRVVAYYKGEKIKNDKKYLIVCNNYRASGGGNFEMFKKGNVVKEIRREITDIMIEYVSKVKLVELEECDNVKIIK